MNTPFEELAEDGREVALDPQRKALIRERLVQFMAANPEGAYPMIDERWFAPQTEGWWRPQAWLEVFVLPRVFVPVLASIVLVGFFSVGALAENSLPGSLLYPVKVNVTEELGSVLAVSNEDKTVFAEQRSVARLEEAETLVNQATLTPQAQTEVLQNFKTQTSAVQQRIQALASSDPSAAADLSASFETSLKAHAQILSQLTQGQTASTPTVAPLLSDIETTIAQVDQDRQETEQAVVERGTAGIEKAVAERQRRATQAINDAHADADTIRDSATNTIATSVDTQLVKADEAMATGQSQLNQHAYAEAFASFGEALRLAQQSRVFMKAQLRLHRQTIVNTTSDSSPTTANGSTSLPDSGTPLPATTVPSTSGGQTTTNPPAPAMAHPTPRLRKIGPPSSSPNPVIKFDLGM